MCMFLCINIFIISAETVTLFLTGVTRAHILLNKTNTQIPNFHGQKLTFLNELLYCKNGSVKHMQHPLIDWLSVEQ
jgi:hypothetical protein